MPELVKYNAPAQPLPQCTRAEGPTESTPGLYGTHPSEVLPWSGSRSFVLEALAESEVADDDEARSRLYELQTRPHISKLTSEAGSNSCFYFFAGDPIRDVGHVEGRGWDFDINPNQTRLPGRPDFMVSVATVPKVVGEGKDEPVGRPAPNAQFSTQSACCLCGSQQCSRQVQEA